MPNKSNHHIILLECTAISEDGNKEFQKTVKLLPSKSYKGKFKWTLSFGGWCSYYLDSLLHCINGGVEVPNAFEDKHGLCIDAMGRNHGTPSGVGVFIRHDDMQKIYKKLIELGVLND